jgi:DnaK suppressor protein
MNQDFLDKIKEQLLLEEERLQREIKKISESDEEVEFPSFGDKEDENAEEVAEYSTKVSLKKKLEDSLRDVLSALQRLEQGKYGTCKFCGQEIDEKRLLARPVSSSCINCKRSLKGEDIK